MNADDVLSGPRGRRAAYEYARSHGDDEREPLTPLEAVSATCAWAMYWQPPWEEDLELARDPEQLRDAAESLAADPTTAWWDEPATLDDQHFQIAWGNGEPPDDGTPPEFHGLLSAASADLDALAERIAREPDPAPWREMSGVWWSYPWAEGAARSDTTRMLGDPLVPAGLWWVEDSIDLTEAYTWHVTAPPGARVYEIDSAAAWAALVRDHLFDVTATTKNHDWSETTGREGRWAMPDWRSVARDWDGVHLTVAGYLTTAGRAIDVDGVHAAVLAGWAPDRTFWLTDALEVTGPRTQWRRPDPDSAWHRMSDEHA